jgi:hypothetical protein
VQKVGFSQGVFWKIDKTQKTNLDISPLLRGLSAKSTFFFLEFSRQGIGAPPAASGRRWRR